jgi:hypothetical protein
MVPVLREISGTGRRTTADVVLEAEDLDVLKLGGRPGQVMAGERVLR